MQVYVGIADVVFVNEKKKLKSYIHWNKDICSYKNPVRHIWWNKTLAD